MTMVPPSVGVHVKAPKQVWEVNVPEASKVMLPADAAKLDAINRHANAPARNGFDFIVNPSVTNHRSRHQRALTSSPVNCYFLDNRKHKYQYQRWRNRSVTAEPAAIRALMRLGLRSAVALSAMPPNPELPLRDISSRRSAYVPETGSSASL